VLERGGCWKGEGAEKGEGPGKGWVLEMGRYWKGEGVGRGRVLEGGGYLTSLGPGAVGSPGSLLGWLFFLRVEKPRVDGTILYARGDTIAHVLKMFVFTKIFALFQKNLRVLKNLRFFRKLCTFWKSLCFHENFRFFSKTC
jgi:hypothetical protein